MQAQCVHLTATGDENVEVDSVMHQEERDKNHLESKFEVPPQSHPLRRRKPKEFPDHIVYQTLMGGAEGEPKTRTETLSRSDGKIWDSAIDSKAKNMVWELEDQPLGKHVIANKWGFKLKRGWIKKTVCYKVRLLTKVFMQCYGLDFHENILSYIQRFKL